MKTLLFAGCSTVLTFIKLTFIPNINLLAWVFIAISFDFITGVLKAKFGKGQTLTSSGFKTTIIKTLQYCGLIIAGVIIGNAFEKDSELTKWVNNGMMLFILYVEVYSIFENLYALKPESKVAPIFKAAMALLTLGMERNKLPNPSENKSSSSQTTSTLVLLIIAGTVSVLAFSSCKLIKPGTNTSYSKTDTTMTTYKPVAVEVKGGTVVNNVNVDSLAREIVKRMLQGNNSNANVDSILNVIKAGLKPLRDTVRVTDPNSKAELKYWMDENGKLQMSCSAKDQQVTLMVAEITRLTKEISSIKKTEVAYRMPWWGWILVGWAIFSTILLAIAVFILYKRR